MESFEARRRVVWPPEMVRLLGHSLLIIKMMTVLEDAQCCLGPAERVGGKLRIRPGAGINTMRNLGGWDVLTDPLSSNWILRGTRFSAVERFLVDGWRKGKRLLGSHGFSTYGSERRIVTA